MNLNNFLIILIVILIFGCNEDKNELPESSVLTAKLKVYNENLSSNLYNCSGERVQYSKMQENDCSFLIGNYRFVILRKYLIDNYGNLKELWVYHSEGPVTYSKKELNQDPKFVEYENIENFNVQITKNRTEIIDSNDTLKIEEVFKNEKLILIENKNNDKERILFSYE